MSELAERLRQRYFGTQEHPYRSFERAVDNLLPTGGTILDAGCGHGAPILSKYRDRAGRLVGIDVVDFDAQIPGLELYKRDLQSTGLADSSVDLVMARSVVEHLEKPLEVYQEFGRILKPGGHFVFLTANLWDYASLIAKAVPNRFHPWIVARTEGREERDVFPVQYKSNTRASVVRWTRESGLELESFQYLGQYPCYFMFNGFLFFLATGYEKLISRFDSLAFLRGWILVVVRKPT